MPSYEYETRVLTHGFLGIHKGEIRREDLEKKLNEMGRQGYHLEHVFFDQKVHGEKDGHLLVFRRLS